jgi:hypothetical protein
VVGSRWNGEGDTVTEDEVIEIQNCVISYLLNARHHFDSGDYARALSFLDLAKDEIEYLATHTEPAALSGRKLEATG